MDTEMRWGGLAGFGAVIFAAIGRVLLGSAPRATEPGPAIAVYLASHRTQIMMASLLYAAAIVLAVWVGVTMAAVFRRAGETGVLPMLVLAGTVLVGAVGLFVMLVRLRQMSSRRGTRWSIAWWECWQRCGCSR